jgi:hypothetical protein
LATRYSACCKARTLSLPTAARVDLAVTALTKPVLCPCARTKQRPFPHRRLCCPTARPVLRPPPTPSRHPPASRLHTGYRTEISRRSAVRLGREGLPSSRRHPLNVPCPHTPGSPSRLRLQDLHRFRGLRREPPGSALPRYLTTRQGFANATDRSVAPPLGLSTLGFDPDRFQTEPPACYRASWQLPGPDFHRQATTSL